MRSSIELIPEQMAKGAEVAFNLGEYLEDLLEHFSVLSRIIDIQGWQNKTCHVTAVM